MFKVSTIIAVKNGERFLANALRSVLRQEYSSFEILVIDGQSEDRSSDIAKSFPEVSYVFQTQTGIGNAWNVGIQEARGEILAFLSCDDVWMPEKLQLQVQCLMMNPSVQYTTGRVKFFLEPGCPIPSGFRKELLNGDRIGHIMETLVVRKSLFEDIGVFDQSLTTGEDVDWFCRAKDYGIPMEVIPRVLVHKRIHDHNLSLNTDQNDKNLLTIVKRSLTRRRKKGVLLA